MHSATAARRHPGDERGWPYVMGMDSARDGSEKRRGRLKNTKGATHGASEGPFVGYVASMANMARGAVIFMLARARPASIRLAVALRMLPWAWSALLSAGVSPSRDIPYPRGSFGG